MFLFGLHDASTQDMQLLTLSYLFTLLEKNHTITNLNISGNQLCYESALSIAKVLGINKSIASLDLSDTELDSNKFDKIVDALKNNNTLTFLNVESNLEITDQSGPSIINMLNTNHSLCILEVLDTQLTQQYQNLLKALLLKNRR